VADHGSFIVQSFLPSEVKVTVLVPVGARALTDLVGGQKRASETAVPQPADKRGGS
jgi:hypothetical protein